MTTPMIAAAFAHRRKTAARNTIFKWIREQIAAGVLRPIQDPGVRANAPVDE
jgi:hypothetical protein